MTAAQGSRFRFGDYTLDVDGRQLMRADSPIALEPRVFDLLAYLVANRERAVSKDELQDAIWAPMIVSETALTRAVGKARKAIGDDANQQTLIRTVHGHGYQFVGEFHDPVLDPQQTPHVAQTEGGQPGVGSASRLTLWVAVLVAIVALVVLWPRSSAPDGLRLAVMPIQNGTGDPEFDWVRYGLMDLATGLFEDSATIPVVASADIVRFSEDNDWTASSASVTSAHDLLRAAYGATHLLSARVEPAVGGLRLTYALIDEKGDRREATMVSDEPARLASGMVQGVSGLLGVNRYGDRVSSSVDADPFINEAYARAISKALEGRCQEAVPLFDVVLARNASLLRAQIERANCQFVLGEWQEAEQALQSLAATAEVQESAATHSEVLAKLGKVVHDTGRLDDAEVLYTQSLQIAESANSNEDIGRVLISMAVLDYDRREFQSAREKLARSTLAFRRLEREVLPGQIYATLANIDMNDGRLSDAEAHLDNALASFRSIGDRRNEAMMINNYGFLRRIQGRFAEALELHEQSLEMRREIGDTVGQGRILGMLSILYNREDRLDEARAAAAESVSIARDASDQMFIATGLTQLAEADRRLGDTEAARVSLEEARTIFLKIEDGSRAAQVDLRLAQLAMERGDLDDAAVRVSSVRERALAEGWPSPAIEAMRYAGDIERRKSNFEQAADWYVAAMDYADKTGRKGKRIAIAVRLANTYMDLDNLAAVEPLLGYLGEQESSASIEAVQVRYEQMTRQAP